MPVGFLSEAEKERLTGFPAEVPAEDLYAFFTLTGPDRAAIPARSAPANRLGFALSLCAVRYLGFCPEDLAGAPGDVVWYVSEQLGVPVEALESYGERPQTRTDHLLEIYRHIGYRRPSGAELADLSRWLLERALEHDDPSLLVRMAAERFKAEKLVRPGLWLLERMVADARERAHEETFRAVSPLLTPETRARLDGLLVAEVPSRPTPLARLGRGATSNTPKAILEQLAKLDLLRRMGADRWDLSAVNPNRLKRLSRLGRRHTAQALERLAPKRRYPILLAFLRDSSAEITDEVVDLFDACLARADARARRELEEFRRGAARATNEKVALFREIGRLLLDPDVPDDGVRAAAYELVGSPEGLLRAVEECERLARPVDDNYFDFLAQRYSHVRQFAPAFLSAFVFRGGRADDPLLADGLRFVVPVRTVNAGPNPKYFGWGRGITYLNYVSDKSTGFHGMVVPGTLRDSLFVLDGLLENRTSLEPVELTSDTAGYSDVVFGLFALLGYQFSPRLADAGEARFWRMGGSVDYGPLTSLARNRIKTGLIAENWDDLLRVAGSLKLGTVTASEFVKTIRSPQRTSSLAAAIAEVGRIAKTLFLLSYVDDEAYRRRILVQLNRHEARHKLARKVFHGQRGEVRKRYREGQEDQVGALGLVVNAVCLWNSLYLDQSVRRLREEGAEVREEDLARVSPLSRAHVNVLGRYSFDLDESLAGGGMRPLRNPSGVEEDEFQPPLSGEQGF